MIRVGFIVNTGKWLGGINYFRNLFYAISLIKNRTIEPVVFLGAENRAEIRDEFAQYAQIVSTSLLDRYSSAWCLWKGFESLGHGDLILEPFLLKQGIQVISHSEKVGFKKIKCINWIPDFQHRHLPAMFSTQEIKARNNHCRVLLEKSDRVIVSSRDALNDALAFVPQAASKIVVLPFVGQPGAKAFQVREDDLKKIRQKYSLPERFCYLPNQLWKHKNHIVVFEALHQLKQEGLEVNLVCSGPLNDNRHPEHIKMLKDFIADHQLDGNIFLLGQLPFEDVGLLYAASVLVINPSLFEGWSTSVEEGKSIWKKIILSDIPVHREQAPRGGIYFDPHDPSDLAKRLREALQGEDTATFLSSVDDRQNDLNERTGIFGESFQRLILEILPGH